MAGPWLWTTRVRILFVLDGRIDTTDGDGCFGLGLVIQTLLDDSFAWWVRFDVEVVRRDNGGNRQCRTDPDPYQDTENINFRFTRSGFNLDDYDQVWFFGDYPANEPNDPEHEDYSPLTGAELKLLAEWMDRGGGVFATGDHYNLGASMCSRIPRVGTMRRWTVDQGVPDQDDDSRNQTLQSAPGTVEQREGDPFPQPIEPVYESSASSVLIRSLTPHPLLCSRTGVIDRFPDHMHEGEVIDDDEVELDRPLNIPGYSGVEYPIEEPDTLPVGGAESVAPSAELPRPRPHVIAYGRTTHAIDTGQDAPDQEDPLPRLIRFRRRFGVVGVYDGDRARVGRVVVDSTWHHWFSLNLHGFRDQNRPVYEGMQAYYRNIGLWLATPAQRATMLFAATWGAVASDPMAFPFAARRSLWAVGERALDVIGRTASQCTVSDLVGAFFRRGGRELFAVPAHVHPSDPYPSALPADLVVRAIVGGIATAFLEPSLDYHRAQRGGRRLLDPDAIAREARKGVELGYEALAETARSSAEAAEELTGRLAEGFRPLDKEAISISVELVPVRIVAEQVQLTDLTDPALVGGRFEITVRLWLAGSIVGNEVIEATEVPQLESQGAFVALDRVLFEGVVQTGEKLVVELIAGSAGRERVEDEAVRFRETLTGTPSTWLGAHAPSREQEWRLWFRVERGDAAGAE